MSQYETDDEKVEDIKKWFKENGMSLVAGIVIGLGAVFGWRGWVEHRNSVGAQASAAFDQLTELVAARQADGATRQEERITKDFGSTPYPALGALVLAKGLYEKGDTPGAIAALQQAIKAAPDPALARLAALRLARIQFAEGQLDAAAATLADRDWGGAFAGDLAALRGDLAAARGDTAKARAEYQQALAAGTGLTQLIRFKLDNLPPAG